MNLEEELTHSYFWDLYISMESTFSPIIDILRVAQKISQYCFNGTQLTFDDLHSIFFKLSKIAKASKSLLLKENPSSITKELFEKHIDDVILRHKVVIDGLKGVIIERKDIKQSNQIEQPPIQFLPMLADEVFEVNHLTKI